MEPALDVLPLNISDNDALAEAFSRIEPGETCKLTLEVKGTKFEFEATVTEVEPGKIARLSLSTEDVEDDDEEAPSPENPVEAVMPMKKGKKMPMMEEMGA